MDTLRPVAGEVQFPGYHAAYQAPAAAPSGTRASAWLTALAGTLIVVLVGGGALFGLNRSSGEATSAAAAAELPIAMTGVAVASTAVTPPQAAPAVTPVAATPAPVAAVPVAAPEAPEAPAAAARKVDPRKIRRTAAPVVKTAPPAPQRAVAPVRTAAPAAAAPAAAPSPSDKAKQNAIDTLLRASAEHPVGS